MNAAELEIKSRRKGASLINRPEDGPHLTIGGALWQIPARGGELRPDFSGDTVGVQTISSEWPSADEVLRLLPTQTIETCDKCGQPTAMNVEIDTSKKDVLALVYATVAALLRANYDLSNDDLASLLAIKGQAPVWLSQFIRWCSGLSCDSAPKDFAEMFSDEAVREVIGSGK